MARALAESRLCKEWSELHRQQPSNCCAWPISGDLMLWEATIMGVRDTPYYLGVFRLRLKFTRNYPFDAPRVNFITKIYHCNIDYDGYICWDLLSTRWTAVQKVASILHAVCALMREPNADDPCDETMAALYRDNRDAYNNNAINWTLRYAMAPSVNLPPMPPLHGVTFALLGGESDVLEDSDDDVQVNGSNSDSESTGERAGVVNLATAMGHEAAQQLETDEQSPDDANATTSSSTTF